MATIPAPPHSADRHASAALEVLRLLFRDDFAREFDVELWDGTRVAAREDRRFVLHVLTPYALRAAFSPPLDLNPFRAFVERWIDMTGDLESAVDTFARAMRGVPKALLPLLAAHLLRLPRPPSSKRDGEARLRGARHSRERDVAAIGFHYDQPLEFYASFLDPNLVYSCAYFENDSATLEEAQIAKIDYLLKKLRLAPGERLLDIGCGWGALVMRAAERFGAQALGVTLSRSQYDEARRRIDLRGLGARASVELRDYRDVKGTFDKVVSVGMVEHVGRARLAEYFATAFRALRPGGLFVNHGIADQEPGRPGFRATGFIDRYVFPDGELVSVSDGLVFAELAGFEVRDVENLREHYARTLGHWVANLERKAASVIDLVGERTYRIWRLYMAGSQQGFRRGRMGLFQSLLAKPPNDGAIDLPPTRRELYVR